MGAWLSTADDEDEEELLLELERRRRRPQPMKMKLGTYAMYRVFTGAGPLGHKLGCAYVGLHIALCFARFLSLAPVPGRDLVWVPLQLALQCICYTATTLVAIAFIRSYMNVDGVYVEEYDPQMAAPSAAVKEEEGLLPPPPPEMDMC